MVMKLWSPIGKICLSPGLALGFEDNHIMIRWDHISLLTFYKANVKAAGLIISSIGTGYWLAYLPRFHTSAAISNTAVFKKIRQSDRSGRVCKNGMIQVNHTYILS